MFGEVLATQLRVTECLSTPVPESDVIFGESVALLTTESCPATLPVEVGANVALKLVFCPAAKVKGVAGPLTPNPAPVAVAFEIVTLALPVSVMTTGNVLVLPTVTFPKLRVPGLADSTGPAALTPADERKATICMTQGPDELSGAVAL